MKKYPGANIRVYAVWMPMLNGDERSKWDPRLLHDPRLTSFWDGTRITGKLFGKKTGVGNLFGVLWDAYFLYGPGAEWSGTTPGEPVSWGRTVFGTRAKLAAALKTLLSPAVDAPTR